MLGFAIVVILGCSAATQFVAWWFRFARDLGDPIFAPTTQTVWLLRAGALLAVVGGFGARRVAPLRPFAGLSWLGALALGIASSRQVYAPYQVFVWYHASGDWGRGAGAPLSWIASGLILVVALLGCAAVTSARHRRPRARSDAHGSAHWGTTTALRRREGLLLGREGAHLLRFAGEGHLLTVAPTRAGKGVSSVIPNLLEHPGSVLVTDPKGENYAVTARWRKKLGNVVIAFDPFGVVEKQEPRSYNPLALIDINRTDALDDARLLADMLVLTEGRGARDGDQAFWNEEARSLLTGLILHAAASKGETKRTLIHVRELLTLPPDGFANLLRDMQASQAARNLVARAATRLLQKAERERSGVVSTAQSHTHFLDSPAMADVLGGAESLVDLAALKSGKASVYLILPPDRLDAYARWLRLMIGCALRAMARTPGQPKTRVLFLLDEFAHLGRMQPVERDIGLAGAFGVSFWLIVQDLAQLRSTYGERWPSFLANVDVLQAFGINDWDTAEYLSRMTGEATVSVESEQASRGVSQGRHGQHQLGASRTRGETGRRLRFADEVRQLPRDGALLFVKGEAPLVVQRLNYLRDKAFEGRADQNPLYAGLPGSTTATAAPAAGSGPLAWFKGTLARVRPWLPPSSVTSADGTADSMSAPPPVEPSPAGGRASVTAPE
jgi:type IV secretion system protein VirD4